MEMDLAGVSVRQVVEALGEFYPEADWQRCTVHWYRNVLSAVPRQEAGRSQHRVSRR